MKEIDHKQLKKIPGSYGFPLIGLIRQGLEFKKGWRDFFNKRRIQYNSNVFRSNAGIKAIIILDQKGVEPLFDVSNISKLPSFGPIKPPPARIGRIIPTVRTNDAVHDQQKEFIITYLRKRSKDILKEFEQVSSPYFQQWSEKGGDFDWGLELNALLSDFLFGWLAGAKPDPKDVQTWASGVLPRELFRLPWQGNAPIIKSMNRILKVIRSGSHFKAASSLASQMAKLNEEDTSKQMLFFIGFNAWIAMHGVLRSIIAELTLNPEWQEKAATEIKSVMSDGTGISFDKLSQMTILKAIIKESLRLHMPAPFVFGRARKDFIIPSSSGNFLVKKGEVVNAAVSHAHRDPDVFDKPDTYDPSRFLKPEAANYLIWAGGRDINSASITNRMCPGRDFVYMIMQLFLVKLIPNYKWTLKTKPKWNEKVFQSANRPDMDFVCSSFVKS